MRKQDRRQGYTAGRTNARRGGETSGAVNVLCIQIKSDGDGRTFARKSRTRPPANGFIMPSFRIKTPPPTLRQFGDGSRGVCSARPMAKPGGTIRHPVRDNAPFLREITWLYECTEPKLEENKMNISFECEVGKTIFRER